MIFLGIDPSLTNTGCIMVQDGKVVYKQTIKSKKISGKPTDEITRICGIRDEINITGVNYVAIEGIAFMARNTTALVQLAALNYFIREHMMLCDIEFVVVAPTSLKKFVTGKGNSGKDIMMLETYKRYKQSFSDNNLCDAFGLARIAEAVFTKDINLIKFQQEVVDVLKTQIL